MGVAVEGPRRANGSEVWAALSTVGGMNRELSPFVRMTDPTHGAPFDAEPWRVGAPVGWQLLFGVMPGDRPRIELVPLPCSPGFRPSSTTWWHPAPLHHRPLVTTAPCG